MRSTRHPTVASQAEPNGLSPVPVRSSTTSSLDIGASPPPNDGDPVEDYGVPHRMAERRPSREQWCRMGGARWKPP